MRHSFTAATCLVCLSFAALAAAGEEPAKKPAPQWEAEVRRLAHPVLDAGLVPGMSIGIWDNGRVETYGLGRLSQDDPTVPDSSTVYEIGSVSKVFTGLLLAVAVGRGEVALDDPLSRHLPQGVRAPAHEGQEITLEQLATHFSGLPRLPSNLNATSLDNPYAAYTREHLFAFLTDFNLGKAPGSEYVYSNLGVGLLGTLLADKAKTDYEALLRERITKPLGMADTGVQLSDDQRKRLAPPHRSGSRVSNWDLGTLVGAGAIRSTVHDLLKLVAAELDPASTPLTAALTLAAQRRRDIPQNKWGIALGWHIAGDGSTLWHTGQTGGYSAAVFISPSLKKGVVVLANGADSSIDVLTERIMQTVAGMRVEPPTVRCAVSLSEAELERLVGDYVSIYFTISITRQGDAISARLTGQEALRVFPESPTRFFYREVPAELEFEIDPESGRAIAVTLLQNGNKIRCQRRPA